MKKQIIILVAIILFQVGISYFVIVKFLDKPIPVYKIFGSSNIDSTNVETPQGPPTGEIFILDDIIINPVDSEGRRIIALTLGLEFNQGTTADDLTKREPQMRDALISILSIKPLDDFLRTDNRDSLRQEMFKAVNSVLPYKKIGKLYITRFIMQ